MNVVGFQQRTLKGLKIMQVAVNHLSRLILDQYLLQPLVFFIVRVSTRQPSCAGREVGRNVSYSGACTLLTDTYRLY